MKKSEKLANEFKSGSIFHIYEEMMNEYPEHGIQGNKIINEFQFASMLLGYLAAKVSKYEFPGEKNYSQMDFFLFKENNKKPYQFHKSLMKQIFQRTATEKFSKLEQQIYSDLLLIEEKEVDDVKFYAAFFRELSKKEA